MRRRHFLHTLGALPLATTLAGQALTAHAATEVDDSALAGASGGALSTWKGATPAFTLDGLDGKSHALSEWRSKVVVLNFWATWCGPCREEIPAMGQVARQYRARGLNLVTVNVKDSPATVEAFLKQVPIDGTVLLDRDGSVFKRYGSMGLPATYLIDRKGNARFWRMGELQWTDNALHGHIEALLQQGGGNASA